MKTILPSFAGHVPAELEQLYPNANITRSPLWAGFNSTYSGVYLLSTTDPLFTNITHRFLEKQTKIYGTDHFYNADTFNEMIPPSNDTTYLSSLSKSLYQSLSSFDPEAIWVIQGWLFSFSPQFWKHPQIKAYLGGVPNNGMLILDLDAYLTPIYAETDSFFGKGSSAHLLSGHSSR